MSNLSESLAEETVTAFRAELDDAVIGQIGAPQFERLRLLVAEAVASALGHAAEQLDDLARTLRTQGESGTLDIEL
jgi:hypothetical protein